MLYYLSGGTLHTTGGARFTEAPLLTDMAVGMGRAARFAGQTNHWWSVLHHIYAGYIAMRFDKRTLDSPAMQSWWVHDAHEAFTADIPSPIKSDSVKLMQQQIDAEFVRHIPGWPQAKGRTVATVHDMDLRMLRAEAYALCPPRSPEDFVAGYGAMPDMDDVRIVQAVQQMFGTGLSSTEGWNSPLVRWWVGRMRRVLVLPGAWNDNDSEELYLLQRQMDKRSEAYGDLHDDGEDEDA